MINRNTKRRAPASGIRAVALAVVFMMTVIWATSFSWTDAAATTLGNVEVSDYAYTGGDYVAIDRSAKSVFYVEKVSADYKPFSSGSGFIMFDERLFITNQHMIENASYLFLMDDDGKQYILDQVIISDKEHDIAILLFPEGKNYQPLPYDTDFDSLVRGQPVLTIGSPKGLPGTVSDGIISAFPKFKGEDVRYIQITAPISHGSSGGCLLNEDLKVIGVTSGGLDEGQNLGFAIPVFIVEQLYRQWNKKDTVTLGTKKSWDTVGNGLHKKVSGTRDTPKVNVGSSAKATRTPTQKPTATSKRATATPKPTSKPTATPKRVTATPKPTRKPTAKPTATPQPTSNSSVVKLGLTAEKINNNQLYALTVNGKKLDWNQKPEAVVAFCNANGLKLMLIDNNGILQDARALLEDNETVMLIDSITVPESIYFNNRNPYLNKIQFDLLYEKDTNKIISTAKEANQKIQAKLGNPTEGIRIYTGEEYIDPKTNDLARAMDKLLQYESFYTYISIKYNNLSLHIDRVFLDNTYNYQVRIILEENPE